MSVFGQVLNLGVDMGEVVSLIRLTSPNFQLRKKFYRGCRAYTGSKFVLANTLAKWKELEPNEINFSQVLTRK